MPSRAGAAASEGSDATIKLAKLRERLLKVWRGSQGPHTATLQRSACYRAGLLPSLFKGCAAALPAPAAMHRC